MIDFCKLSCICQQTNGFQILYIELFMHPAISLLKYLDYIHLEHAVNNKYTNKYFNPYFTKCPTLNFFYNF